MKTIEQIRKDAEKIYNNLYEYIDIDRSEAKSKIIIKCKEHGIFKKHYYDHLVRNQGCPNCTKPAKLSTDIFIKKAKIIHNDIYDYSEVAYKNMNTKVCITCINHGIFLQLPGNHLSGQKCPKCCKNFKYTTETFIKKANEIYSNLYDYSITEYHNINTKIKIKCNTHGIFEQIPQYHLSGYGCQKCSNIVRNTDDFIVKSNIIHKNIYDYSQSNYLGTREQIKIICKIHGIFSQSPNDHLSGNGCQKCAIGCFSKISIKWLDGIAKTENIFIQHAGNIGEKKIKINDRIFKFDGFCETSNTVYEFYGDFWHGNLSKYNQNDIHPIIKKPFGDLYNETIQREKIIISEGYNLITIWESEFI